MHPNFNRLKSASESIQNFLFTLISLKFTLVSFRKLLGILLVNVTLIGSMMDLHDLVKLPRLIEHYQQHKKKSADVSFLGFLNLHYGSEADRHDQEEHEEHQDLPFKSPDCTFTHTVTVLPQFKAPEITSLSSEVRYSNFYHSAFSSEFSQTIWQPPKNS
jgi:hypothetical protein